MSSVIAERPDLYEVVNGQVVEKTVSAKSTYFTTELQYFLGNYVREKRLGKVFGEMLFAMPDRFEHDRRPDLMYVSAAKWPLDQVPSDDRAWDIVPDLCVEVVSPTDSVVDLMEKIDEYFEAGVKAVWVVYPLKQRIDCYSSTDQFVRLRRTETLRGDPVIPGFELPLSELFLPA
jgi:Uma2 family endonuclease